MLLPARSDSFIEGRLQIFNAASAAFFFAPVFWSAFWNAVGAGLARVWTADILRTAIRWITRATRPAVRSHPASPRISRSARTLQRANAQARSRRSDRDMLPA